MGVRISSSFDVPGLAHGYGTGASVSLKDEDGKYQADVSTNYGLIKEESVSRDVSAKFPDGSEYNNHTCLYVGTSAGTIRYNYEWQKVD